MLLWGLNNISGSNQHTQNLVHGRKMTTVIKALINWTYTTDQAFSVNLIPTLKEKYHYPHIIFRIKKKKESKQNEHRLREREQMDSL